MAAPAASSITIRRRDPAGAWEELSSIGLSWPHVDPEECQAILRSAVAANDRETAVVMAAHTNGELIGAVVAQVLPGRAATVSPPQIKSQFASANLARQLLLKLDGALRSEGVELAQALLATDDTAATAALRSAEYEHAADLLYMAAEEEAFPDQPFPLPFELVLPGPDDESRLVRVVDATYAGTLDCPRIDGLRTTADVLAGYRAVGESGDRLWRILRVLDVDIGCLLLADHPQTRQHEIVYVGLVPEFRGRGWGLELTRHAQWLARQAGRERVVLAVDAANEPAIRVYSAAGFRAWDRRAVWIKPLVGGPTALSPKT